MYVYSLPVAVSSPRAPGRQGQGPAAAPLSAQARAEARRPKPGHRAPRTAGPAFFDTRECFRSVARERSPSRGDSRETGDRERKDRDRELLHFYLLPLCEDAPWDLRHVRDGRRRIYPTQCWAGLPTPVSLEREGGGRGCAGQCGHGARGTIPIDTHRRRRRRARLGWLRPWCLALDTQGVVCAPLPLHLDRRLVRLG